MVADSSMRDMYYFLVLVQGLSVLVLIMECFYIFVRWRTKLQGVLFFSCVATLVNSAGYLMAMTSGEESGFFVGAQMSYLGRTWIPFALFLFVLQLCDVHYHKPVLHVLGIVHVVTYFLVVSSKYHRLYYSSMDFSTEGIFPHLVTTNGPWHVFYDILVLFYIICGIYILIKSTYAEKDITVRKRLITITLSIVVESGFFVMQIAGFGKEYDLTMMGYSIGALIMCIGIMKYDMLETLELARDTVIDDIPETVIILDQLGRLEYANKNANELFDLEGQLDKIVNLLDETLEKGGPLQLGTNLFTIERKKLMNNNSYRGVVYVLEDDTSLYEYMDALKNQTKIAEEALMSRSAFIAIVSHEIRTPMNAIVGMAELLLRDKDSLSEQQYKFIGNIKHSGDALMMIVNDILDQSKLEAGKMELIEGEYELQPMLDDVKLIIENRVGQKPIDVSICVDERVPRWLIGDSLRIRQIIINLMNNSVKFTECGFVRLNIDCVDMDEESVMLKFLVEDSGQGIKPEDLGRLGSAFTQVDSVRNHAKEGTGLGLSISREFINMMGGRLEVTSIYGQGSSFFFTISQGKVNDSEARLLEESTTNATDNDNVEGTWQGKKILVVDDTEVNLIIMQELMKPLNANVDAVGSGESALAKIQNNTYDCIFIDYMMPNMDGVETTRRIRELRVTTPIISMTGDESEETHLDFVKAGISDFIKKPIDYKKVVDMLKKWL